MKFDMNDTRTPRERIGDQLLERMLEESRASDRSDGGCPSCTAKGGRTVTDCRGQRRTMPAHGRSVMPEVGGHCGGEGYSGWGLHDHPLAMAYSPMQVWRRVYDPEDGLCRGTIFAELDLPFGAEDTKGGKRYE